MPAILYGAGAYRRDRGDLPEFLLVNMFLEKTPSAENGVVLLSRAPLEVSTTVGSGPIRGLFSQEGTFGGDTFTVSGAEFYRGATLLGTIAGSGPVSIASSGLEVLVTAGTSLYSYNGTNFVAVTLPDNFSARAVTFISGHFVVARNGSQKFYWSAQLDGRSFDALDFAAAESEPDHLLDTISMRGNLYLMGQSSIEPWFYTGTLDLPFSLIQQRLFPKGTYDTGCALEMDNALLWVGSDRVVYRTSDVPERLSDHGIEERISQSATVSVFPIIFEGHSLFCIRLDTATFGYDAATGQLCELQSYGRANFAGRCAAGLLFGDDTDGTLWTFSDNYDEEDTLVREFTAAFPIKGGAISVDNVTVDANVGQVNILAGPNADPLIEMATSRNGGISYGNYRSTALGQEGQYRTRARWNRAGMFDSPGAMFKFRVTYPVDFRVSNVWVNEAGGGISRGS